MKLGLLKFAAADPERFLRMVDGGKLGEAGQHVADLQLEKNGKHDESEPVWKSTSELDCRRWRGAPEI